MLPKILVFSKTAQLYQDLSQSWFKIAQDSIQKRGWFAAALCGGKTPKFFYRYLAKYGKNPLWQHTHLFLTDERMVSAQDKKNNGQMIRKSLLDHLEIPPPNIHFVNTDKNTVRSSAKAYEDELKAYFRLKSDSLPKFDLILLGVGEDGHTASLFPFTKVLQEKKRAIVFSLNPQRTQWRVSLSLPALNKARNVFFLVTGKNKAKVIKRLLRGKGSQIPAALVLPQRGKVSFFLDYPAGFLLNL